MSMLFSSPKRNSITLVVADHVHRGTAVTVFHTVRSAVVAAVVSSAAAASMPGNCCCCWCDKCQQEHGMHVQLTVSITDALDVRILNISTEWRAVD
jgi:hypothetical protein